MRDEKLNDYFQVRRHSLGVKSIYTKPQDLCIKQSIEVLRKNEILFVQLDQHFGASGSVKVNFFNQAASTATGPVILSLRTEAVILPLFIIRQSDDTHKIVVEEPFLLEKFEDYNKTLQINIQRITDIIEKYIRKYPAEWGWIHRRWKK
jgi:KDO2-lipid IV(A) lauroyltransferase